MPFNIDTWKQEVAKKIPGFQARMKSNSVNTLYYFLAATSLFPLVQAIQTGDLSALASLSAVLAGSVSTNLIANIIQKLKDKSEEEIAQTLQQEVNNTPALKAEIDELLRYLDTLNQANRSLSNEDKEWFTQTIQEELKNHKNSIDVYGNVSHSNLVLGNGNTIYQVTVQQEFTTPNPSYRSVNLLSETPKEYRFYNIPDLPNKLLSRHDDLQAIIASLKEHDGRSLRLGVHGMGGVGKSVLAAEVAHSPEVKNRFPDGIFWIAFGQNPDLGILQGLLGKAIGDPTLPYGSIQEGRANLAQALKDKICLIILDDIWKEEHAEAFDLHRHPGCLLLTSRNRQAMETFGAQIHYLNVLNDTHSLDLLSDWAEHNPGDLPQETQVVAKQIVKECGNLPLALAMAGALVKEMGWEYVLYHLQKADLEEFTRRFPYDHPNLLRAIQISIENLTQNFRELYYDFAVFPEDTSIPIAALEILWEKPNTEKRANEFQTQKAINLFASRSLLQKDQKGQVTLHDLQMDYIRNEVDLQLLHRKLINAYRNHSNQGWHTGPNDGYFIQHLAWHLWCAGFEHELYLLLLDYRWLKRKLAEGEINSLIFEYDLIKKDNSSNLWQLQLALRLAKHILSKDTRQLPSQLIGRLMVFDHKGIAALLADACSEDEYRWLKPLTSSLTHPGTGELMTLEGHNSAVCSVVVFPNGKQAISASKDRTLKIWDLENGNCLRTLNIDDPLAIKSQQSKEEGDEDCNAMLLTQDQKYLISAIHSKAIMIWNVENGLCINTLEGHTEPVSALALSANEKRLISGSGDHTVKIWDIKTGECLYTLFGHHSMVRAIALSQNNEQIFSGGEDGTVIAWLLQNGELISTFNLGISLRSMVLTTNPEELVISGAEGVISVCNTITGEIKKTLEGHNNLVSYVTTIHHGNHELLISASWDHTIRIWNLNDGTSLYNFEGHSHKVNFLAPISSSETIQSENVHQIISASEDHTLKVWDLNIIDQQRLSIQNHKTQKHIGPIKLLALVASGKKLVSASQDGFLKCWDMERSEYICNFSKHRKAINTVAVSSDGNTVISAGNDKRIEVWNIEKNERTKVYKRMEKIQAVLFVPNERKIVVATDNSISPYDSGLIIINLESHEQKALHGHIGPVYLLNVTPDGQRLISAARGKDNTIKVWDLNTGKCINTLEVHRRFVVSMALAPNGKQLAMGLWNGNIKIWDIEKQECQHMLKGHTASVHALTITPDGKTVVSGSWDKTLRAWNIETGECSQEFIGHSEIINQVSISPDGKNIISVANDRTLKVWDLDNGNCISTYWADAPMYITLISQLSDIIVAGDQKGEVHFLKPMGSKLKTKE